MRAELAVLSSLAAFAITATASASPAFPPAMKSKLSLSNDPSCAVCHEGGKGGSGTVTTAFGRAMMSRGLKAGNTDALSTALDSMATDKVDSDGDGVIDLDELKAGKDPNGNTGIAANAPPVEYGCGGATVARTRSDDAFPIGVVLFGAVLVARRRRGRALLPVLAVGVATFVACQPYEVAYVSSEVCQSGSLWTGGNSESELMNPGQACIKCHSEGEGPRFTIAGTLYGSSDEKDLCGGTNANGAVVYVTDKDGRTQKLVPNELGNFFSKLPVTTPYTAWVQTADGKKRQMATKQTIGDCNLCHTKEGAGPAPTPPGRVLAP